MKKILFVLMLFSSAVFFGDLPFIKYGKIARRSPYNVRISAGFLPYNPMILMIGSSVEETLSCAALREKGTIYSFQKKRHLVEELQERVKDKKNIYAFLCSTHCRKYIRKCREMGLNRIDALFLDIPGQELEFLEHSVRLFKTARVLFVSTDHLHIPLLQQYLQGNGFTLVSYWEKPDKSGRAFFAKTIYYKGIYERKLL